MEFIEGLYDSEESSILEEAHANNQHLFEEEKSKNKESRGEKNENKSERLQKNEELNGKFRIQDNFLA